jgi:hypothetical protein
MWELRDGGCGVAVVGVHDADFLTKPTPPKFGLP